MYYGRSRKIFCLQSRSLSPNSGYHCHRLTEVEKCLIQHVCITVATNHSTNGYMCKHMSSCKEIGRKNKCDAEVCHIVFSGGVNSGATLTSVLIGQCLLN
jgi:hypothetical protein